MILRQISPAIAAWALSLGIVLIGARRRPSDVRPVERPDRVAIGRLVRYAAILAAGGYGAMICIELVFGVVIVGEEPSELVSAATSGAVLMAVAVPSFLLLSRIDAWIDSRRAR
jgi:hypothetical protein